MAHLSRRRLGVLAAVAVLGLVASAVPASGTASFKLTRVAGSDRYSTASAIAADAFPGTTATALVASGDDKAFADALAGAYLSGLQTGGAPLLLTERDSVPASTTARLSAMGAKTVIVLGGTGVVSTKVEQDLDANYTVSRVAGTNRYDTAAKIAQSTNAAGVGTLGGKKTAIVASGEQFPDALAAGPIAFAQRFPIVLTRAGDLPTESRQALTALGITHMVIAGGTSAVGTGVETELKTLGTTERVSGTDRYATAAAIADFAASKLSGWSNANVDLATGDRSADALTGGPAAGRSNRSILLTATSSLSASTRTWLESKAATLTGGRVLGGTTAVSEAVKTAAETAGGAVTSSSSGQVTGIDTANNRYAYVPTGGDQVIVVTYKTTDKFTVGGQAADVSGFESNLSVADAVAVTQSGGVTTHAITNVDASKITSGTIGNIDPAGNDLDIINVVSGTALRSNIDYGGSALTLRVDGTDRTLALFERELNEGDTIVITGNTFALTNVTVSGTPSNITKPAVAAVDSQTSFTIGALGDVANADQTPNDATYVADAEDDFTVDGNAAATYATFNAALNTGDDITYKRTAGLETYTLVNKAPSAQGGQAVNGLNANGGVAADTADGGSFTMATATGTQAVTYTSGSQFVVNGVLSSEAVFEQRYSAGDNVSYRSADAATSTAERLELTDADLAGRVGSVNTADTAAPGATDPANSYAVLASNGITELATVAYTAGDDVYFVNGAATTLALFEAELNAIKAGTKIGSVVEQSSPGQRIHRLTTS